MLLVVTSNNLIVMWAAIEATTLSSAFLVGIYGQRSSLESAWKYIIIWSRFLGSLLVCSVPCWVYANAASVMPQAEMAIFWSDVLKQSSLLLPNINTVGLCVCANWLWYQNRAISHDAWLPDAHSEAPKPVSALLSAVLLNCALLVLICYYIDYLPSHRQRFPQPVVAHLRHVVGCRGGIFLIWYSGTLSVCWRTPAWRTWGWSRWR
ncbi:proton-conducting transporter membrane subunit [Escherichia coli]